MKAKIIITFIAVVIAMIASWNINGTSDKNRSTDLILENIEALANSEMTLEFDNYSVVIKCEKMCLYCGTIWTDIGGYGNSGKLKGICKCGVIYS